MAIYHFSARVIGRGQGRSVVAAAAYRSGMRLHDERLGQSFDYAGKTGVVHSEILLPEGAPRHWSAPSGEAQRVARAALWNAVEAGERRKDSQLARDIEIALPRELGQAEAIRLARDFVAEQFVARGMVADLNVHWGRSQDGGEQPHAHVLLTMRRIEGEGFGRKEVAWNDRALLRGWRERWAELANERLAEAGHDRRIDHRSLAAQDLELAPQNKIGPAGARREARGEDAERAAEHRAIARANGARLLADPGLALRALTGQQSTFTRGDLARLVHRQSDGAEQFAAVMAAVQAHPELVRVGRDGRGQERFSTREMVVLEAAMVADAAALSDRTTHAVALERRQAALAGTVLGEEQRLAFGYATRSRDLVAVVGYAGTGKSTLLGVAREAWEGQGYRVRGAALSGIAAEGLEGGSGIASRTVHSLLHAWGEGRDLLSARDVLVVDEAGMIGSRQMAALLRQVRSAGAKLVLVGDPEQLQAIEAGAAFRAIVDRVGASEIRTVVRQRVGWQREATVALARGRTEEALERYRAGGMVHGHATDAAAMAAVVADWDKARRAGVSRIMLAHTRAAVEELNGRARRLLREAGLLGEEREVATERGARSFAPGDRVYFLRNDRGLGVKNGTLGTVEAIGGGPADPRLTVRLDGPGGVRRVEVAPAEYGWIDHGYAATVHKAQSVTVERALVLATPGMDRHLAYVALSRHRGRVELHWSVETFGSDDQARLPAVLGRERAKDTTLDYGLEAEGTTEPAWAYAERRGLHPLAPASDIVVRRNASPAAPAVAVPATLPRNVAAAIAVADTLRARAEALREGGRELRRALEQDPAGVRRQARERLEGGRLRAALLAVLPEVAELMGRQAARLEGMAETVAGLPARLADGLRQAVSSGAGETAAQREPRRGRFAGLRLQAALQAPVPSPVVPPAGSREAGALRWARELVSARAAAERMRAAGLPVLAHQERALEEARRGLDAAAGLALSRPMEAALAARPQLAAELEGTGGAAVLGDLLREARRAEAARAAVEEARQTELRAARERLLEEEVTTWVRRNLGRWKPVPAPTPGQERSEEGRLHARQEAARAELREKVAQLPEAALREAQARWARDAAWEAWRSARAARLSRSPGPGFGPGS
ncbi:Ti-type conjugative transfer relaxase TraA [Roseomonas mucosa]|uniref:Ti-type conjugative transfer relaxase TraA n=1 Tax=Roseomonas mucosa TaxID=207340 RepID=UPI001EF64BA6|nr:Ti-type conjugative transfer relaxase TraA [Roseomonas mucosa]